MDGNKDEDHQQQNENDEQLFCGNSQSSVDEHANVLDEIDLEDSARVHGFTLNTSSQSNDPSPPQVEPDFLLPGSSRQEANVSHETDEAFRNYDMKIKFIADEEDIDQSPKFTAKRELMYNTSANNSDVTLSFLSTLNDSSKESKDNETKEVDESVFMGSMDAPDDELETSKEESNDGRKSDDGKSGEDIERHESLSDNIGLPPDEDLGISNLPILPEEDSSQMLSENEDVSNTQSQLFNLNFDPDNNQDEGGKVSCICLDDDSSGDDDDVVEEHSYAQGLDQPCTSKRAYEGSSCSASKRARRLSSTSSSGGGAGDVDTYETDSDSDPPAGAHQWLNQFTSWSGSERAKCLKMLIKKCSADQIRQLLECIEPLFQRDFIRQLPKEVALQILRCLSPQDLLTASRTSRYWRFLADDNLLWKEQCVRIGITSISKRIRLMPLVFSSAWKAEYMRNKYIEHKWLSRPMASAKILKAHDDHVITCLQFYGNTILSGSDDTTLKLWSAITGKCLRTLIGHTGGVWSSQMYKKTVISGSTDRTLRVWDADTGACLKILTGHTSTVRCMHLHEDRVVSGSRDATLRVWSVSEGQCLKVLVGHLAAVRCVQYNGKLVVSGAYDYYVKVWNPETGECLHTLAGHTNRVYSLQFDGQHIVSGSLDTSIIVWDVTTGAIKHSLTGHQSLTSGMELRDNILVSGNADSTVKVWDIITGQCLHTLAGPNKHQSAVTCLQLNNRFVITSSDDGTVKLWDVKTGEFIRNLVTLESGGSGGVVWRIRASQTKLVCAVGSRNGTEETKLMVMNFDVPSNCQACQ